MTSFVKQYGVLDSDEVTTIALFAKDKFNAILLTDWLCALKAEASRAASVPEGTK
jgi:hypothetical protein